MKNLKTILFVILAGVFVLQSCQQEVFDKADVQTEVKAEKRIWGLIIAAVVTIVVKLSEGQHQGGDNGCAGIGSCGNHSFTSNGGQGTGSTSDPNYVGDFETQAYYAVTESGEVILAMDENSDPAAKATMFYDQEIYMSPTQIIDNPEVLHELGLVEPVVMEEGFYEVHHSEETQYIVIQ